MSAMSSVFLNIMFGKMGIHRVKIWRLQIKIASVLQFIRKAANSKTPKKGVFENGSPLKQRIFIVNLTDGVKLGLSSSVLFTKKCPFCLILKKNK
jgi:hypothetical protein